MRPTSRATVAAAVVLLALVTAPVRGVPFEVTHNGPPNATYTVVARIDGPLRSASVTDTDGDGVAVHIVDFAVDEVDFALDEPVAVDKRRVSRGFKLNNSVSAEFEPLGGSGSLIAEYTDPPTLPFTLGQELNVVDGRVSGRLDELAFFIYTTTASLTAEELLRDDLSADSRLSPFTGTAQVSSLASFVMVPEPTAAAWLLAALPTLLLRRHARRLARGPLAPRQRRDEQPANADTDGR